MRIKIKERILHVIHSTTLRIAIHLYSCSRCLTEKHLCSAHHFPLGLYVDSRHPFLGEAHDCPSALGINKSELKWSPTANGHKMWLLLVTTIMDWLGKERR